MEPMHIAVNIPSTFDKLSKSRTTSPWPRRLKITVLPALTMLAICLIVIFIGAAVEKKATESESSTSYFYQTSKVCGVNETGVVDTYPTANYAHSNSTLIAHCGECGFCSNDVDIQIYDETKNSLTETSTSCAKKAFLGGREAVYKCFTEDVGFTDDCNECWTDNVMCDMKNCVFTCIKMLMFGGANNKEDGELNDCLKCDEKRCGPAYITCAGANRRRSGIVSAIGRDESNELCKSVDEGWMERF